MTALARPMLWRRDDWTFNVQVRGPAQAVQNLNGYTVGAEFYIGGTYPSPGSLFLFSDLTITNGGIDSFQPANGSFRVLVPQLLTAKCPIDVDPLSLAPTFIRIYFVDPYQKRQTMGVICVNVYDGPRTPFIDTSAGLVIVWQDAQFTIEVPFAQGLAGPTNIAAEQINDAGATGVALVEATSAAQARGIIGAIGVGAFDCNDQDYAATPADFFVRVLKLTAARNITLPDPTRYAPGQSFKVADFSGACSPNTPINLIAPQGSNIAGRPSYSMASALQRIELDHNGKDTWVF